MMSTTIVIASYRYGHLAGHAIESVLSQTVAPSTIVFVDDGAFDCAHLPSIYPQIEYVFRDKNMGIVSNFNDMLHRVTTDRVMFLGADNWLRDDTLQKVLSVDRDIVTYDIIVTGARRDEILERHPDQVTMCEGSYYWDRSSGHHGSMLYNVSMAKDVGGYDSPSGRTVEDQVLYNRLLSAGATREHIPAGLLFYRRHKENFNHC